MQPYKPPVPIPGHIFTYGKTSSGKTQKNLAIAQYYYSHGYKIWDIFGGLRKEGPFWCFPSDDVRLWKDFLRSANSIEFKGPRGYKTDLYYPLFKSKTPNYLPEKLPDYRSFLFTINFKDLDVRDVSCVIGSVSSNQERVLERVKKELPPGAGSREILEWFEQTEKRKKMKGLPIYYAFFEPFCREHLFEGPEGKNLIDLKQIAKEKDRIFVLNEDYIPKEKFRYFFIHFFIKKLFELVNEDKIHKKNILLLREINMFMKVEDEATQDREQKQILRNEFSNLLRYGRSGVFALVDSQSPKEVRNICPGNEGIICLNTLPGDADREAACERPRKDGRLNQQHIAHIGTLPTEQMAVLEATKPITKIKRMQPSKTMGWTPEKGKFINVWKDKYNEFKDIREEKERIIKKPSELEPRKESEVEEQKFEENQEGQEKSEETNNQEIEQLKPQPQKESKEDDEDEGITQEQKDDENKLEEPGIII